MGLKKTGRASKQDDKKAPPGRRAAKRSVGRDPAEHHRRTRLARAHEVSHDYVEVIAELIEQKGEARAIDIARRLGVTHVTVNRTVARLVRQGLVNSERYRSIFLTPGGHALARDVRHRHVVVLNFLLALGIREEVARTDAEGIEHHVSEDTLRAFERFTDGGRMPK